MLIFFSRVAGKKNKENKKGNPVQQTAYGGELVHRWLHATIKSTTLITKKGLNI